MALGIRDGKEGWFHLYAPSNPACFDDGEMWGMMVRFFRYLLNFLDFNESI